MWFGLLVQLVTLTFVCETAIFLLFLRLQFFLQGVVWLTSFIGFGLWHGSLTGNLRLSIVVWISSSKGDDGFCLRDSNGWGLWPGNGMRHGPAVGDSLQYWAVTFFFTARAPRENYHGKRTSLQRDLLFQF